jgi:hypothetical protein
MRRSISESTVIAAPPGAIYDFMINLDNWSTLDDTLIDVSPLGLVSIGASGTVTYTRMGRMRITTAWDIVDLVPGRRYACRIVGRGYELVETVDLTTADGGTRVSVIDDLRSTSMAGRVMVPVSSGIIRRDLEKRLARLKALLEAT